jgi:dimethylargininase
MGALTKQPRFALVRPVPKSYVDYYASKGRVIDGTLAAAQHAQYVAALEEAGLTVMRVPPEERFPDCVFIEDTAIVCQGHALVVNMQNAVREGEQGGVAEVLRKTHSIVRLPRGAMLDGGDVMRIDDTFYVGMSARTNEAGFESVQSFAADLGMQAVAVPVRHCLHLKTGVTYLGHGTLLAAPGWFDLNRFCVENVIVTGEGEEGAANTLRIGRHLLAVEGYPQTANRLREFSGRHGVQLGLLPMSEFQKGDGSLTCLSIIW